MISTECRYCKPLAASASFVCISGSEDRGRGERLDIRDEGD